MNNMIISSCKSFNHQDLVIYPKIKHLYRWVEIDEFSDVMNVTVPPNTKYVYILSEKTPKNKLMTMEKVLIQKFLDVEIIFFCKRVKGFVGLHKGVYEQMDKECNMETIFFSISL